MGDQFDAAKTAAINILRTSVSIVAKYRRQESWLSDGCLRIPALEFGNFLRDVIDSQTAVSAISGLLIESKLDMEPVTFGQFTDPTAHQVATTLARCVGSCIWLNLWTATDNGLSGTAFDRWPVDGLMDDRCTAEFTDNWPAIAEALSRIEIGDTQNVIARIRIESAVAKRAGIPKPINHKEPHVDAGSGVDAATLPAVRADVVRSILHARHCAGGDGDHRKPMTLGEIMDAAKKLKGGGILGWSKSTVSRAVNAIFQNEGHATYKYYLAKNREKLVACLNEKPPYWERTNRDQFISGEGKNDNDDVS